MQTWQLIEQLDTNLEKVCDIMQAGPMELTKQNILDAEQYLQKASCAMTELKNRVLGVQPPKQGN